MKHGCFILCCTASIIAALHEKDKKGNKEEIAHNKGQMSKEFREINENSEAMKSLGRRQNGTKARDSTAPHNFVRHHHPPKFHLPLTLKRNEIEGLLFYEKRSKTSRPILGLGKDATFPSHKK